MKMWLAGAGAGILLLLIMPLSASAQTAVPNGDLELQALGPWVLYGDNAVQMMQKFDTDGDGTSSWCWMRKPGSDGCNGGIKQQVYLIGGVTYDFDADVAFRCTC